MRNNGIIVNDVPLQHLNPDDRHVHCHSIISEDPELHIPLSLEGTMSGFTVRKPTLEELEDVDPHNVTHVHMTSSELWDPQSN